MPFAMLPLPYRGGDRVGVSGIVEGDRGIWKKLYADKRH